MNNCNSPFMCYCAKVIPLAFDESMSYYEVLCALTNYLKNEVTPKLNNTIEGLETLENYVKNYFENLDVQDEINNKLDEMAESGELTEIITEYLQVKGILAYDTVANMKLSDNLVDGSFVKTYGNTTLLDGKGRFYKVRQVLNTDIIDEINIIALLNPELVAELIPEEYLSNIGDLDDLETTDKSSLVNAINEVISNSSSGAPTLKGKNVIVIGDSLSITGRWGTYFINYSECNGENYGNGSAGFVKKGITPPYENMDFNDMLNYIISNKTTSERNDIDYIIVGGGINDALLTGTTVSSITSAVNTFITTAKTNFPNAKLIIFPINTFKWLTKTELNKYNAIIETCENKGIMTTGHFLFWKCADNDYNLGDNVHLTDTGYQVLASKILSYVNGSYDVINKYLTYTLGTNWTVFTGFSVYRKDNIIYVKGILKKSSGNVIAGETILTFTDGDKLTLGNSYNSFNFALFYNGSNAYAVSSVNIQNGTIRAGRLDTYSTMDAPYVWINCSWPVGITGEG